MGHQEWERVTFSSESEPQGQTSRRGWGPERSSGGSKGAERAV